MGVVTLVVMVLAPPAGMVALVTMVDTEQDVATPHRRRCPMRLQQAAEARMVQSPTECNPIPVGRAMVPSATMSSNE